MNRRSFLALLGAAPVAAAIPLAAGQKRSGKLAAEAVTAGKIGGSLLRYGEQLAPNSINPNYIHATAINAGKIESASTLVNIGQRQPDGSFVWGVKDIVSGRFV